MLVDQSPHIDSLLIRSLKESRSRISGRPKPKYCKPRGDGDRGGSLAPGWGRDFTRIGIMAATMMTMFPR